MNWTTHPPAFIVLRTLKRSSGSGHFPAAVFVRVQVSRKGLDPRFTRDFSREDLHDLELAAGLLASSSIMQAS